MWCNLCEEQCMLAEYVGHRQVTLTANNTQNSAELVFLPLRRLLWQLVCQSTTVGTLWLFSGFTINKSKISSQYNSFWKSIGDGLLNRCFAARSAFFTIFVWYHVPEASPKAVPSGRIHETALLPLLCGLCLVQATDFRHGQDASVSALHPSGTKKMYKGNYCPILLHQGLRFLRVNEREDLRRGGGGRRANIHRLLTLFLTTVNPACSVFTLLGSPSWELVVWAQDSRRCCTGPSYHLPFPPGFVVQVR